MLPEFNLLIIQCKKVVTLRKKEASGEEKIIWFCLVGIYLLK